MYYPAIMRTTTPDPLAEKYYHISPYAWCGNNPVNRIDLDGMKIVSGNMTEEERKDYDELIEKLNENKYFKTLYTSLDKSEKEYKVSFGEIKNEGVRGYYSPDKDTDGGGNIVFARGQKLKDATAIEELFHAYQDENKTLNRPLFNIEFEAKAAKQLMYYGGYLNIDGMDEYQDLLLYKYGNRLAPYDVSSPSFLNEYMKAANKFAIHNNQKNIGNEKYKTYNAIFLPTTLMRLINLTYFDNK